MGLVRDQADADNIGLVPLQDGSMRRGSLAWRRIADTRAIVMLNWSAINRNGRPA